MQKREKEREPEAARERAHEQLLLVRGEQEISGALEECIGGTVPHIFLTTW